MEIQRLRIEKGLWNPCLHGFQKDRWRSSEDYSTLPQCPEIASFIGLVFCRFLGKKDTQKISNSWDGIFSHINPNKNPGFLWIFPPKLPRFTRFTHKTIACAGLPVGRPVGAESDHGRRKFVDLPIENWWYDFRNTSSISTDFEPLPQDKHWRD